MAAPTDPPPDGFEYVIDDSGDYVVDVNGQFVIANIAGNVDAPPPDGYAYLTDADGAYLTDATGRYLLGRAVSTANDGDGAESCPPRRNGRLFHLGGVVGRDIPVQKAQDKVLAAQKALRKAVTATVKNDKAPKAQKALEKAADAILDVQDLIPQTDWDGLWRAYVEAQTASDHEARVRAYALAEMQAQAMVAQLARLAETERRRADAEQDEEDAIHALLTA